MNKLIHENTKGFTSRQVNKLDAIGHKLADKEANKYPLKMFVLGLKTLKYGAHSSIVLFLHFLFFIRSGRVYK